MLEIKNKFINYNNDLIKQIQAYQTLMELEWQPLILKGINKEQQKRINEDLKLWGQSYLKF